MTYSPLTDKRMPPTGKYWTGTKWVDKWQDRPANVEINGMNVHHWAATSMSGLDRLVKSNDPASVNYLILNDGTLIGSVPEEFRAWTTSAYANDDDKITVEIQNETGAPSWRISDAAMATLIRLYADVAKRHKFAATRARLKGHQEYGIATACPGPYLLPRLDDVAKKAAGILSGSTPIQEDDMTPAQAKQLDDLSKYLLREFTDGDQQVDVVDGVRRGLIIDRRNEARLQELVASNRAQAAAIETLAKSAGLDPKAVTAAVASSVDRALANLQITLSTEG